MKVRQSVLALASLLALSSTAFGFQDRAPVDFRCEASKWKNGPTVSGGLYTGRLESVCHFKGIKGGTLAQLETALSREVIEKADKVNSGPTATTYQGLPATYFDATTTQQIDSMEAVIRADVYFATDGTTRFLNGTKSKEITATGMAKNLKMIALGFDLQPTATGDYNVTFYTEVEVTKPGAVPAGMFKNKVTKGLEDGMKANTQEMITKFTETL